MAPSDEELVERFRNGEACAFDVFVRRWASKAQGAIYRPGGPGEDAALPGAGAAPAAARSPGHPGRGPGASPDFMTGRERTRGPGGDVMDCDAFRDEMMDLLYGEAAPATARRFEEHQAACRECRDELDSFRRLRRELAAWHAPADLAGASRWRPSARPYLAVAAAFVLLVGGGFALRGSELRYEQGRFAFRLGRAPEPAAFAAALAAQDERP